MLLEFEHVGKSYRHGSQSVEALRDVSLELLEGELVSIWGLRGCGRSALLRLAAGIEAPDTGAIRLGGTDLAMLRSSGLPEGIAYCQCPSHLHVGASRFHERSALEQVMVVQMARGLSPRSARARSLDALARVGARGSAELRPVEMAGGDAARTAIARALSLEPRLLLLDEPTGGVDVLERDEIFDLLRSLAREDGIAVLACIGESAGLFGVDRGLTLSEGELHGALNPELARVVDFRERQSA